MIGSFGDVVFKVSSNQVLTLSGLIVNRGAEYAEHKIINSFPVLEKTGRKLATASFDVKLSYYLKVIPQDELEKLENFLDEDEAKHLYLGKKHIGHFVLTDLVEKYSRIGGHGEKTVIDVSLSIKEYVRQVI